MASVPIKIVLQPAFAAIESLGFRRAGRTPDCIRDDGPIRAEISLLTDRVRMNQMNVLCYTNISHADVHRLWKEVTGYKTTGYLPIVGSNLRHLIPEASDYGYWASGAVYRIPRNECPPAFIEQLHSDLATHGVPFLERHMTEESILDCLMNDPVNSLYREFSLPFLLHLRGRSAEAADIVRVAQKKSERLPPEAPVHLHQRRMLDMFERATRE